MDRSLDDRITGLAADAGRVHHGPTKVMSLGDAVRRFVTPGTHLHLSSGLTRPQASCYEVLRALRGTRPGLRLSCMSLTGPNALLVHEGLVEHAECTFHGETLPTPGPNPLLQAAYADGRFTLSSWSILSFTQRLWAGALGLPWVPTKALVGSSMAEEDGVVTVDGQLVVPALRPDVALVHAPAADVHGNVLCGGPFGDGLLGAWGATRGAVVTVERIVPTEVIAAHPQNFRLPAAKVLAVCEVPMGAHPGPLFAGGVEDLVGPIAEDTRFLVDYRGAVATPGGARAWSDEWVHGVDHDGYLAKLGGDRLARLRGRAELSSWREDVQELAPRILREEPPTPAETAVVLGARSLGAVIEVGELETVLAGVGLSNLAAWMARAELAARGRHVALMVELGLYDYAAPPGDPLLVSNRVARTAAGHVGVLDILGSALASTRSAGILGAGQVDRSGNLNSSRTADGRLLVGSGGSNDVASICRDVVVVLTQSARRMVEQVPYVTAPGARVSTVATQHGVYRKREGVLVLAGVVGGRDGVARARADCGWDLHVADDLEELAPPSAEELAMLRGFDPRGEYTG